MKSKINHPESGVTKASKDARKAAPSQGDRRFGNSRAYTVQFDVQTTLDCSAIEKFLKKAHDGGLRGESQVTANPDGTKHLTFTRDLGTGADEIECRLLHHSDEAAVALQLAADLDLLANATQKFRLLKPDMIQALESGGAQVTFLASKPSVAPLVTRAESLAALANLPVDE